MTYSISFEHFGTVENLPKHQKHSKDAFKAPLNALRKKKKQLRKAWKQISSSSGGTDHASKALAAEWRRVMKEHSRLSRSSKRAEDNKRSKSQQRNFTQNPFLFGRKLFEKKSSGEPQFSAEQAFNFFSTCYRDEGRGTTFEALEGMVRPKLPVHFLSQNCPSLAELKASAWQKRNGAAPGLNGISYVLFKRCPSVLPVVHKIVQKVWSTKIFPASWAAAFIRLLPKSDKLTDPRDFRPIALTNTVSKIFLSGNGWNLLW